MRKILIIFAMIIFTVSCEEKHSEIVIKGLENVYSDKSNTIEKLCLDEYELFYFYHKNNNKYYKSIKLNKISSDLWIGITGNHINNKNYKEEKIYYKNGKYYDSGTDKERKDLDDIKPYFQNDTFKHDEFEVIHETNDIFVSSDIPSLYAKYKDKKPFNDYFSHADIKDENEDITIYAQYGDGKKYPSYLDVYLERKNEQLGESCILKTN